MGLLSKVFVVGPVYPWRGGIAHSNNITCEKLAMNNKVTAISFSKMFPDFLYPGESQKEKDTGEKKRPFEVDHTLDPINILTWIAVAIRIRKEKPDRVIFQWWHTFFFPCYFSIVLFGRNRNTRFGAITQNVLPHEKNSVDFLFTRIFFSSVDYFVSYSKSDAAAVKLIVPGKRSSFMVEPTTETNFGGAPSKTMAQKTLGIASPAILFFGFVRKYKGLKWLLRAMPLVLNKYPKLKLMVVGEFWDDKNEYVDLIAELGIGSSIRLVSGYVPNQDVPKYFRAADCVVMPYESSTQSGIIQLAFGYNTPIITTAVGGNPDMIENMRTGILVEPEDETRLADAIMAFYRKKLGQKFRAEMKKRSDLFSWTKEKEKIVLGMD